jgi:hypothetical protein
MSIIKSIMHKFNGTDYDTLHPETEHAQVTDFGQGVVTHLLASTLASTVTAVTSGSLFGKMVQLLLTATGCKYLMAQNGYICFGSLFGGLILQWGIGVSGSGGGLTKALPISFSSKTFGAWAMTDEGSGNDLFSLLIAACSLTAITLISYHITKAQFIENGMLWIALGY